ncbi:hypothetical protein QVD17_19299 [Tagetes erecta]|uniref:Uncharacterized protein n=1 Tax=Tagetes erecta TaxID=13708 RepID=A0AAD8KJH3_TARER|nr:hypothetical protein QVD17_19299 [Tagetes erecta]
MRRQCIIFPPVYDTPTRCVFNVQSALFRRIQYRSSVKNITPVYDPSGIISNATWTDLHYQEKVHNQVSNKGKVQIGLSSQLNEVLGMLKKVTQIQVAHEKTLASLGDQISQLQEQLKNETQDEVSLVKDIVLDMVFTKVGDEVVENNTTLIPSIVQEPTFTPVEVNDAQKRRLQVFQSMTSAV